MAASHFFRLGKVKGNNGVLEALRHNKRELQQERGSPAHIDVARTPLNYTLTESNDALAISRHAKAQMQYAGIEKPRKNGVMAVEIIYSLPVDWHERDSKPFFDDCYHWTLKTFAGELLSFDVHLDESAPHAHALVLPLVDGKMQGRDMVGGKGNLYRLINLFHKEIGNNYGLSRRQTARLNQNDREAITRTVMKRLSNDSVQNSAIWAWVRDSIHKDPIPCAQLLGLSVDTTKSKKAKTFVDIKRSHGKGSFET